MKVRMNLYTKIALLAILLFCAKLSKAQQDVMYTQYMFNGLAINPAYAGSHDAISTTALFRKQWVKINGAPTSMSFSAHSPLPNERLGIGALMVKDAIGINDETNLFLSGSYYVPVQDGKGKISFGLQAGVTTLKANFGELTPDDPNDPMLGTNPISGLKPNFGGGVYYRTDKTYLGLSVPRLMQNKFADGGVVARKQSRHYFINGGHVIDLTPNFKLKPNFMIKTVPGAPVEIDLNANVLFMEKLWVGVSWRTFDSMDAILQYYATEQLSIGYAYDFTTTQLGQFNSGSHEIMINYLFNFTKYKVLTPRYF